MKILIVDGQGGNIGRQLVKLIGEAYPDTELYAVGTNSIATANMLKGGSVTAATGENAAAVASRKADIIVGPVGIVIADALMGEVTPSMAAAIGSSNTKRILIPINKCDTFIAGVENMSLSDLLSDAILQIGKLISKDAL